MKRVRRIVQSPLTKALSLCLFVVILGGFSFSVLQSYRHHHLVGYDYALFYYAFQVILKHQPVLNLYHMAAEQSYLSALHFPHIKYNQYVYPPQFAVLWSFLGYLPLSVSTYVWMAFCFVAYGAGVYWIVKILWPRSRFWTVGFLLVMALLLYPFQNDLLVGNVNSLLFAEIALSMYLRYSKHRAWWAGVPLAIAIISKVTPAVILLYFMLRREWRVSLSALATAIALSAITAMFVGIPVMIHYAQIFLSLGHTSMQHGPAPYNQSILGVLGLLSRHHVFRWTNSYQNIVFDLYAVIVAGGVVLVSFRKQLHQSMDISMGSLTPLLFSPLVEQMHMVYAVPALLAMLYCAQQRLKQRTGWRLHDYSGVILTAGAACSWFLASVPGIFCINLVTSAFHPLYWLQAEMFFVLLILFAMTIWQSLSEPNIVERTS